MCGAVKGDAPMAANGMYVVIQVVLKEKFLGTGSGNLTELEGAINAQAALGYRLHTITTAASGSKATVGARAAKVSRAPLPLLLPLASRGGGMFS